MNLRFLDSVRYEPDKQLKLYSLEFCLGKLRIEMVKTKDKLCVVFVLSVKVKKSEFALRASFSNFMVT